MNLSRIVFLSLIICAQTTWAKNSPLQVALAKYSKAKNLQTEIKKTDEKVILGTKTESLGVLKFLKNKIFISQTGEKKVEFYYNEKTLILVEYPDADFGGEAPRKVTTIKKSIPPLVQSLLNLFSDPKTFNKEFIKISEKVADGVYTAELQPKQKTLKSFSIKIDTKSNDVTEIAFVDDVDTKTTIAFSKLKLNTKITKKDFVFNKLKTDEEMTE